MLRESIRQSYKKGFIKIAKLKTREILHQGSDFEDHSQSTKHGTLVSRSELELPMWRRAPDLAGCELHLASESNE